MLYSTINSLYKIWQTIALIDNTIKISNIDDKNVIIKWINGQDSTSGYFNLNSHETLHFPFHGVAMRLWAEYHINQPQTLFEWTRKQGDEQHAIIDISLVDGIGASFNLIGNNINITADFNSNVCNDANSPYTNNGCLSPCSRTHDDIKCCAGKYNTPHTCTINNHAIDFDVLRWCNAIKKVICPARVYCFAYDDRAGTLSNPGPGLHIVFWDNLDYQNANNFLN